MSRQQQQTQGVVLTGYHSNAELLPKTGLCAPGCPPALDPDFYVYFLQGQLLPKALG
ncbi:putative rho GTPase-activating protein 18 [Scophthalmus maximus]|uniref:Putative rho GTPase-activating protein 18 n=1 Tax=Scophthalmus maximus TaxID=52904 RepID=A0A2U9CTB6_SCOMX|nr:putative rho GTPase-activating protein 18 [Scophthalmus maximus]